MVDRHWRFALAFFLLALNLLPQPAYAADSEAVQKQHELLRLQKQIKKIQNEVAATQGKYDRLTNDLRRHERKIGDLNRDLKQLDRRLVSSEKKLDTLQVWREKTRKQVENQKQHLTQQIRTAYSMGKQEYLKLLLNQERPEAISRSMTYYGYLNRERVDQVNALNTKQKELQILESQINEQQIALKQDREQKVTLRDQALAEQKRRNAVLAKLARRVSTQTAKVKSLKEDEVRLGKIIKELNTYLSKMDDVPRKIAKFASAKGHMKLPVNGSIKAHFGQPRQQGKLRWDGMFIESPEGREVKAIYHGQVAFADWLRGMGLLMIIDHGDGYMSLYAHNQSLFKEVGEWVSTGEVIASTGNTGGQQKSGLYFEIRHEGRPTNPERWVRR